MNRHFIHRKPTLRTYLKSPRGVLEANVQMGLCAISLVGSTGEIRSVVTESLPEGKYCFIKDFLLAIDKVADTLMNLHTHKSTAFVMIDRPAAMKLIFSLVLAETKTGGVLDERFDPEIEIRASHAELVKAVGRIQNLLTSALENEMSIEDFRTSLGEIGDPELTKQVLKSMSTNSSTVRSTAGPVLLKLGKEALKDLPSDRIHELDVAVTLGFNDQSNSVSVVVRTLLDADETLFSTGDSFRILCLDLDQRISLLIAQAARKTIRVKVSLPRVPIIASRSMDILATLRDITVLEYEDIEQLKCMLVNQLKLEL